MKTIIVTRHEGALEWLRKHHPELTEELCQSCQGLGGCAHCGAHEQGEGYVPIAIDVLTHATPDDVRGNRVIGVLPEELSSLCAEYWKLSMNVPPGMRGKEISCADMERLGCSVKRYEVKEVA